MKSDEKSKHKYADVSVVFLGAGRPERGESPPGLRETFAGLKVLDWLLKAFPDQITRRQFVGGYRMNELVRQYRGLEFVENPRWDSTGAAGSLYMVEVPEAGQLVVSYSDILYRSETVERLIEESADIVVAVDSYWKERYQGRSREDLSSCEKVHLAEKVITRLGSDLDPDMAEAEFIGLVLFRTKALEALASLLEGGPRPLIEEHLSYLVERLRLKGLKIRAVDVQGDWAELDDPRDLARFVLGTKAQTLDRLRGLVKESRIEEQVSFTVAEWQADSKDLLKRMQKLFNGPVVVRSSALSEDSFTSANAGAYTSLLDVPADNRKQLTAAVNQVVLSYGDCSGHNQVLVQPMVRDVRASGVVFTRTLERGAPYYVINYDDHSGSTAAITGGASIDEKMLVVRRDCLVAGEVIPAYLKGLLPALREIEALVGYDSLDIEFAVNSDNLVHILQVRPIAVDQERWKVSDEAVYGLLGKAEGQFLSLQQATPFAVGSRAIFGIMPDWNPAEIIGTNPGALAASLYRFLIMDEIWATQRAEYGYRDVRPLPLMVSFANRPYVDVRASFNSFIPAKIEEQLAARLVDFYLDWLARYPHLHDKVEFEVVPTCYSLGFERWEKRLMGEGGFSKSEVESLREALLDITLQGVKSNQKHLEAIERLAKRFDKIMASQAVPLDKAYLFLRDCKSYGTLPFSHLARNAFVAVTLLKSAVRKKVISQGAVDDFLNSIKTVGNEFTGDAEKVAGGELSFADFVERYGHLRPGTYDLTVDSYGENPEQYLRPIIEHTGAERNKAELGKIWSVERQAFYRALNECGIDYGSDYIEAFMREAIEGREYAKFLFSRNLSAALDCLVNFGEEQGLSRQELAHVAIEDLLSLRTAGPVSARTNKEWLSNRIEENKELQKLGAAVELPPLLKDKNDFVLFSYPANQANFIGCSEVTAACVDLAQGSVGQTDLAGKIAMIPQADPGYDWLFGQGISGLITMYGGANSHMAIRAAEFGLPAAIGVGEVPYRKLAQAVIVELNSEKKWLKVIR